MRRRRTGSSPSPSTIPEKANSPARYNKLHLIRHYPSWHDDYDKWRRSFFISAIGKIRLMEAAYALQPPEKKKIVWPDGMEIPVRLTDEKISANPPGPGE